MSAKLIFTSEADDDISHAYDWYEDQRTGLGEEFLEVVQVCVKEICREPLLYQKTQKNYRRARLRKFPYFVVFKYERGTVKIISVWHAARNPDVLRSRLK